MANYKFKVENKIRCTDNNTVGFIEGISNWQGTKNNVYIIRSELHPNITEICPENKIRLYSDKDTVVDKTIGWLCKYCLNKTLTREDLKRLEKELLEW